MTSPAPQTGFLAEPSYHRIDTTEAQQVTEQAQSIMRLMDGIVADGKPFVIDDRSVLPIMALDRAADLLQQAAFALRDQRHRATGWPAV